MSAGDASVDLFWDLVNSAQSYRVEWESDPSSLGVSDGTAAHGSLTNGLRYLYTVTNGAKPVVVSAVPAAPGSSAPSSVSISPGLTDNTLSWSPVTGATAYRVYWSYTPNVTPSTGTQIDVDNSQTTYIHGNLDAGVHYYYVVTAVLSDGTQGAASAEAGAPPGRTATVTATVSDRRVDLIVSSGALIKVATSRTFEVPFSPFPPDRDGEPIPIPVPGLANGTRYAFRVRPVFTEGVGPASTTVYATPRASGVPPQVTLIAGRGVNTIKWDAVSGFTNYDVSWSAVDTNGNPVTGSAPNITGTQFRHVLPSPCSTLGPACPTYAYVVTPSGSPAATAPTVEAVSVDLRPVPPLVTNTDSVILAGVKPSGSRIDIQDENDIVVSTVLFDRETGWTATVPLNGLADKTFVFHLIAFDETGLASIETMYQVTRDKEKPTTLTVTIESCQSATASLQRITLSGSRDSGSAVFRVLEPSAPDQQIAGATNQEDWSAVIDVEEQTFTVIAKDAAGNASEQQVPVDLSACPP